MHLIKNSYEKFEIPFFGALFRTFSILEIIFAISLHAVTNGSKNLNHILFYVEIDQLL